jgi:hypothetical protein
MVALFLGACGGGGGAKASQKDQLFLSDVHISAPDIASFRTNVQLTRLGQSVCDDFGSGASYEELADRLALSEGSKPLPSEDLGAVIDAAVQAYCPQFNSQIG